MDSSTLIGVGPTDPSVLYDQAKHVSEKIMSSDYTFQLQTRSHKHCPRNLDERVLHYLHLAGLYGIYQLLYVKIDRCLLAALVERWRPETHIFHFPSGELTVTLQDVEVLGGVRVDGPPLMLDDPNNKKQYYKQFFLRLLGVPLPDNKYEASGVNVSWLKQQFPALAEDANDIEVQQYTRAVILMLVGGNFLADKSGDHVTLRYLPLLEDFEDCGRYSWGSAILGYMYRNLNRAALGCRGGSSVTLGGALILLQLWAWIRLIQVCPISGEPPELNQQYAHLPRHTYGHRWIQANRKFRPNVVHNMLVAYRDSFDTMSPEQVVWEPYSHVIHDLPEYCRAGMEIWRARVPLICLFVAEYHYPDRVNRQFGITQGIPNPTTHRFDWAHTSDSRGSNQKVAWTRKLQPYGNEWGLRRERIEGGLMHYGVQTCTADYMHWYKRITRRRIARIELNPPNRGVSTHGGKTELMVHGLSFAYSAMMELSNEVGNYELLGQLKNYFDRLGLPIPQDDPNSYTLPQEEMNQPAQAEEHEHEPKQEIEPDEENYVPAPPQQPFDVNVPTMSDFDGWNVPTSSQFDNMSNTMGQFGDQTSRRYGDPGASSSQYRPTEQNISQDYTQYVQSSYPAQDPTQDPTSQEPGTSNYFNFFNF